MKKRILYVDDEEANLYLFSELLSDEFDIITCDSGIKGLEKLKDKNNIFDFILSDLRMPAMDGVEFLKKVKAINPEIPRYILTAFFQNEKIVKLSKTGLFIKYFEKPIDLDEILKEFI